MRGVYRFLFAISVSLLCAGCGNNAAPDAAPPPAPAPQEYRGLNYLNDGAANVPAGAVDSQAVNNTVNAQREFRIGVQAYHRFAFNEAIQAFERANSWRPGEALILDWLGRAYYRSGLEESALNQWQSALDVTRSSAEEVMLRNRIEMVRNRRSLLPLVSADGETYAEAGRFPGRNGKAVYFRQPASVLVMEDGTAWVAAYGSNELVRLDANGLIRARVRGPLAGFDRPYDIARAPDGRLYVSEFRGGRVSVLSPDGAWLSYIGGKGRGEGEFVGPQNLALDADGYLYVVDYGNRRVSKFDPDGGFILSFGKPDAGADSGFRGFLSPTGIACLDERVFVADGVYKQIYEFDRNGSYSGALVAAGLNGPESLRAAPGGGLLAADTNRVVHIDPDSAIVTELGLASRDARFSGADLDKNGSILAANFPGDEVAVLAGKSDMAAGFFVQIDRVDAGAFPEVTIELSVQDRNRRPVVGLNSRNFIISENNTRAANQAFLGASYLSPDFDLSVVFERSPETAALGDEFAAALGDIAAAGGRLVSVISAGELPVREPLADAESAAARELAARGAAVEEAGGPSPYWRFDQALRLAAGDLLPGAKKRAVIFVASSAGAGDAAGSYSLSELASYLANNGIAFYAVIVDGGPTPPELAYLCEQTGGAALDLYRPLGVTAAIRALGEAASGSYSLRYRSGLGTNSGQNYLPVEAEVYLLGRSGRGSAGYFAPKE